MRDLIDRRDAIEKFAMTAPQMSTIHIYEAVDILDSLQTVQLEPQWIPIAERLPKDGTWNIFTDGKNISVERYKADAIDHFFPPGRWFDLDDAVAWIPLPAPYVEVVGDDES